MAAVRPAISDESSDLVDLFKLEATYTLAYTSQVSKERDPSRGSRKIKVERKWYRGDSLGHGAFGAVWVERDSDVPGAAAAVRAVKVVSKAYMRRTGLDYRRELIALARMSKDPDEFVEFYGWFEDEQTLYLTMEYLPYGDLSSFVERGIPESEVKLITIQLLEGLAIMHGNSFTHRDLKPANIFVKSPSPHWWVKIGDFGISKRVRENTALRTEIGTRGFLAPEVALDGGEDYSSKVDLWSLGCVVFKSLAQAIPFPTYRSLESFCSGGAFPVEPLAAKNATPEGVDFLRTLLVADPKDRLTAEEALDAEWLQTSDAIRSQEAEVSSVSLINKQTRDTGDLHPGQDLSILPIDRETLPRRPQDNKEQESSQIPLLPDIASKRDIKSAQATQLLLGNGFDIHAVNFSASTALLWAAEHGHDAAVKLLLATDGFDPDSKDSEGRTPLSWAAENGHEAAVRLLLSTNGVDPDSKDLRNQTPLSWAAKNGHEAVVRLLLSTNRVDPDSKDSRDQTPLSWAAENGHEAAVRLLLSTDEVDPDSKDKLSQTPLSWAASRGHETVVRLLLSTDGIDPDFKDYFGQTPLEWAARNGHDAVVKLLQSRHRLSR